MLVNLMPIYNATKKTFSLMLLLTVVYLEKTSQHISGTLNNITFCSILAFKHLSRPNQGR